MSKNALQLLIDAQLDSESIAHIIFETIRLAKGKKAYITTVIKAITNCALVDNKYAPIFTKARHERN